MGKFHDVRDVSAYFKDGRIFSIERMVPHNLSQDPDIAIGEKVVCFGYPGDKTKRILFKAGGKVLKPLQLISQFTGKRGDHKDKQDSIIWASNCDIFRVHANYLSHCTKTAVGFHYLRLKE
jgi:hypothetical protein